MRVFFSLLILAARSLSLPTLDNIHDARDKLPYRVSMDPRPFYLVDKMVVSDLKSKLQTCEDGPFAVTGFSIGHRGGGTLQFPEETVESTVAGARMGAGILECDVTFTSDLQLVCRHSLCDLHTTTDILLRPELAKKCTKNFTPAKGTDPADALCCTSDITRDEFQTLCAKQDGFNASAQTPQEYQHGTPSWRTDLYDTCGTVMTLDSWITLTDSLGRNFTPELKTPPTQVPMPFKGYTQEQYARDMLNVFVERGIRPERVWAQTFHLPDLEQWLKEYPEFGKQAILLDQAEYTSAVALLPSLKDKGVRIVAPPIPYLLQTNDDQTFLPSSYATTAQSLGLDVITWSLERSGPLSQVAADKDYYYQGIASAITGDGQMYEIVDILAREVGIKAMFSDWSSTVTYYANCMGFDYGNRE